jgi:hypothetical protein
VLRSPLNSVQCQQMRTEVDHIRNKRRQRMRGSAGHRPYRPIYTHRVAICLGSAAVGVRVSAEALNRQRATQLLHPTEQRSPLTSGRLGLPRIPPAHQARRRIIPLRRPSALFNWEKRVVHRHGESHPGEKLRALRAVDVLKGRTCRQKLETSGRDKSVQSRLSALQETSALKRATL